jgi:hypothetical protein
MAVLRFLGITLGVIALGVTLLSVELSAQTGALRVLMCHKNSSTSSVTISVSPSEVPAHLAAGDTLGACNVSPSR